MKQISLRLPDDLYEGVEQERGLVPRETWIKDKLAGAVHNAARQRKANAARQSSGGKTQPDEPRDLMADLAASLEREASHDR